MTDTDPAAVPPDETPPAVSQEWRAALLHAADLADDFDPFDMSWSDEEQRSGERVLALFAAELRREAGAGRAVRQPTREGREAFDWAMESEVDGAVVEIPEGVDPAAFGVGGLSCTTFGPRVGGALPALRIGMVVVNEKGARDLIQRDEMPIDLVSGELQVQGWPVVEVYAPWGGGLIWRRS